MKVVVVGNGILGLTTAMSLLAKDSSLTVSVVGPFNHTGCASLAAAAMFNSFCEVDTGTFRNKIEEEKFLFNRKAAPLWKDYIKALQEKTGESINHGFGTFLINNHVTDELEDRNFDEILKTLQRFEEPHNFVKTSDIINYKPIPSDRASRAIYIPNEGWINPIQLINGIKKVLENSKRVSFVNTNCSKLNESGGIIRSIELENGEVLEGDSFLLAVGANFTKLVTNSELGLKFPKIFYGVGASILLSTKESTLKNCVRTPNRGLACGLYSAPQTSSETLIGASNFITPAPEDNVRLTSLHGLLEGAMKQLNSDYYRSQFVRVNVGWRPTSEDTVPLIGATSIKNLFVSTGTKRDGLHCSPLISDIMSDIILNKKNENNLSLYTPERAPLKIYTRDYAIQAAVENIVNAAYQHGFKSALNRMVEDMVAFHTKNLEELHDEVGAVDWGIPPEMINMYKYKHATLSSKS